MKPAKFDEREYQRLMGRILPRVIHSEEENERYTAILEELLVKRKRTAEEKRMIELLTLLIEDFEEKHYSSPLSAISPNPISKD
jgi:HTH-type transcriptional regulator / antitoxin HigA